MMLTCVDLCRILKVPLACLGSVGSPECPPAHRHLVPAYTILSYAILCLDTIPTRIVYLDFQLIF